MSYPWHDRAPEEVRVMVSVAKAPTCSICGGILSGFRRDPELRFPVYFCPHCEPTETMAPTAQVMPEAGYEFDEEEVAVTEEDLIEAA